MDSNTQPGSKESTRARKMARYQFDDLAIALTPPMGAEGPLYCSNLFGNNSVERVESMYDRINREITGPEQKPLIPSIPRDSTDILTTSISIGLSGITLKPKRETSPAADHLLLLSSDAKQLPRLSISKTANQRTRKTSQFESKHIDTNQLLEVFNELQSLKQSRSPVVDTLSPLTAPLEPFRNVSSRRQRKVSAPPSLNPAIMDQNKSGVSNFFFGGALNSLCTKMSICKSETELNESSGNISRPSGAAITTSPPEFHLQAEEVKKPVKSTFNKAAFREMNLWAPQSM